MAMFVYQRVYINIYWLVVLTILKNIRQWEGLSQKNMENKMFQTTNQYIICVSIGAHRTIAMFQLTADGRLRLPTKAPETRRSFDTPLLTWNKNPWICLRGPWKNQHFS